MIIEKVFSNIEEPEEVLYSVLMTEEELRVFSKKKKKKSKKSDLSLIDLDYLERLEDERKANKWALPVSGGVLGASLGGALGGFHSGKGLAAGAALGAAAGAYGLHKLNKKVVEPKNLRDQDKYKKGSKEDREYFRHQRQADQLNAAIMNAGVMAGR